nr:biotin/lipoyl-containing protein [Indiicoccus explosivorum]
MAEVRVPQVTEDVDESLIVLWYVSEGDTVEKGDALVEIQTEKAVSVIEAEESGTVIEINVKRGESAKVGTVIAKIE